jgi:hypothetical protein
MRSVAQIHTHGPFENVAVQGIFHEARLRCVHLEQGAQVNDERLAVRAFTTITGLETEWC